MKFSRHKYVTNIFKRHPEYVLQRENEASILLRCGQKGVLKSGGRLQT